MKDKLISKHKPISNALESKPFIQRKEHNDSFFASSSTVQSRFFSTAQVQAKLEVGQPNDKYEKEADAMSEQVVQKIDGSISSSPIQNTTQQSNKNAVQLHKERTQDVDDNFSTNAESLETRLNASKGAGKNLSKSTKLAMEPAFGADFSAVKIHTDATSIQMNQELGAKAFTHGSHVYFNNNQYQPESSDGKKLLAHELTHVIQQTGKNTAQRALEDENPSEKLSNAAQLDVQPKMGFEFQTTNNSVTSGGKKLTRSATKGKPVKPKKVTVPGNLKMEVDGKDGDIEFVTDPYDTWAPLEKEIQGAVAILEYIKKNVPVKVNGSGQSLYAGFETRNYGKLDINVDSGGNFKAKPQSTEGMYLEDLPSYINDNVSTSPTASSRQSADTGIKGGKKIASGAKEKNLKGLITLIIFYLTQFKNPSSGSLKSLVRKATVPKNIYFLLMSRMNFVDLVKMMTPSEIASFEAMVGVKGQNQIEAAAGVMPDDPLFPHGYWMQSNKHIGRRSLFSHYLVIPLGKSKTQVLGVYVKKKKKVLGNKTGYFAYGNLPAKYQRHLKKAEKHYGNNAPAVTVRNWLRSMYDSKFIYNRTFKKQFNKKSKKHKVDLLSPLPGWKGSASGGYSLGGWDKTPGGFAAFETRNYPLKTFDKWVDFAKAKYTVSAINRGRVKKP